jgi:hypothetical protein
LGGKKPENMPAASPKPTEGDELANMLDAGSDGGIDFNPNEFAGGFDGKDINFDEEKSPAPKAAGGGGGSGDGKGWPGEPGFVEWSNAY